MSSDTSLYNGKPFEWDRPNVGLYGPGSLRIITNRGPDGAAGACHKASDEEVKFIMLMERVGNDSDMAAEDGAELLDKPDERTASVPPTAFDDRPLLSTVVQQRQRQDSTNAQLGTVRAWANRLGCYDAADVIRGLLERSAP